MDGGDQRELETVKLCFEFLKHLTTLSIALTVIVISLLERAKDTDLAFSTVMFAMSSLTCLVGMWSLTYSYHHGRTDTAAKGVRLVGGVLTVFVAGLFGLMVEAYRVTDLVLAIGLIPMMAVIYLEVVRILRDRAR